jgi:hypothetical protein
VCNTSRKISPSVNTEAELPHHPCLPGGAFFGDAALKNSLITQVQALRASLEILIPPVVETEGDTLPPACVVGLLLGAHTYREACDKAQKAWNFKPRVTKRLIGIASKSETPVAFTEDALSAIRPGADLCMVNKAIQANPAWHTDIKEYDFLRLLRSAPVIEATPRVQQPLPVHLQRKSEKKPSRGPFPFLRKLLAVAV